MLVKGATAGEFKVLYLIVLVVFSAVDEPFASCMLVQFLEMMFLYNS